MTAAHGARSANRRSWPEAGRQPHGQAALDARKCERVLSRDVSHKSLRRRRARAAAGDARAGSPRPSGDSQPAAAPRPLDGDRGSRRTSARRRRSRAGTCGSSRRSASSATPSGARTRASAGGRPPVAGSASSRPTTRTTWRARRRTGRSRSRCSSRRTSCRGDGSPRSRSACRRGGEGAAASRTPGSSSGRRSWPRSRGRSRGCSRRSCSAVSDGCPARQPGRAVPALRAARAGRAGQVAAGRARDVSLGAGRPLALARPPVPHVLDRRDALAVRRPDLRARAAADRRGAPRRERDRDRAADGCRLGAQPAVALRRQLGRPAASGSGRS